jgi:peptidoglycan/xylan/chitin deacetylase (PgdA/CDA1 family)
MRYLAAMVFLLFVLQPSQAGMKRIALTIDDSPGTTTEELLDVLERERVPATFFVIGRHAEDKPELVEAIIKAGHGVGNHSYSHPQPFNRLPPIRIWGEIHLAQVVISRIAGRSPRYFRAPGGSYNSTVRTMVARAGLRIARYTDLAGDYQAEGHAVPTVDSIVRQIVYNAGPGGIILLHDGVPQTVEALPIIIDRLRAMGYIFVTLNEVLP